MSITSINASFSQPSHSRRESVVSAADQRGDAASVAGSELSQRRASAAQRSGTPTQTLTSELLNRVSSTRSHTSVPGTPSRHSAAGSVPRAASRASVQSMSRAASVAEPSQPPSHTSLKPTSRIMSEVSAEMPKSVVSAVPSVASSRVKTDVADSVGLPEPQQQPSRSGERSRTSSFASGAAPSMGRMPTDGVSHVSSAVGQKSGDVGRVSGAVPPSLSMHSGPTTPSQRFKSPLAPAAQKEATASPASMHPLESVHALSQLSAQVPSDKLGIQSTLHSFAGAPHPSLLRAMQSEDRSDAASSPARSQHSTAHPAASHVSVAASQAASQAAPSQAVSQAVSQALSQAPSQATPQAAPSYSASLPAVSVAPSEHKSAPSVAPKDVSETLAPASLLLREDFSEYLSAATPALSAPAPSLEGVARHQAPSQGSLQLHASVGSTFYAESRQSAESTPSKDVSVDLSASQIIQKHMSDYASAFQPSERTPHDSQHPLSMGSTDNPFQLPGSLPYSEASNPYKMPDIPAVTRPPLSDNDVHSAAEHNSDHADSHTPDINVDHSYTPPVESVVAHTAKDVTDGGTQTDTALEAIVGREVWEPRKREHLADFVGVHGPEKMAEYREDPIKALEIASASMIQDITKDLVGELDAMKASLIVLTEERNELLILVEELRRQLAERKTPQRAEAVPIAQAPEAAQPAQKESSLILNWVLFQKQLREAQAETSRLRMQLVAKDMLSSRAEKAEDALVKAEMALMDAQYAYDDLADCRDNDIDHLEQANNELRGIINTRVPRDDFATMQEKAARHQSEAADARSLAQREQARLQGELAAAQDVIRKIEDAAARREQQLQALLVQSGEEQERLLRQLIASEQALLPELREKLIVQRETIAGLLKTIANLERDNAALKWDKEAAEILAETTERERETLERDIEGLRLSHSEMEARLNEALKENGEIPKLRKLILEAQSQVKFLVDRMRASEDYVLKHKDTIDQLKAAHSAELKRQEERIREQMKGEAGDLLAKHYGSMTKEKKTSVVRSITSYPGNSVKTRAPSTALPCHSSVGTLRDYTSSPMHSRDPIHAVHILHDKFASFPSQHSAVSRHSFHRNVSPLRERL